jgi:hypothetical protein
VKKCSLTKLVLAGLLAMGAVVGTAAPAYAVAPNGTYSNWTWPATSTGYDNFDQRLTILGHSPGTHYFWAHQMHFVAGDGGYLGLQVGSYPNNTKIALFSLWSANGAEGANCGPFLEGGPGYTCRIDPYNWVTGRAYRLRVAAFGEDALGEWWGAWVHDTVTGVDSYVGKIRVPASWGGLYPWSGVLDRVLRHPAEDLQQAALGEGTVWLPDRQRRQRPDRLTHPQLRLGRLPRLQQHHRSRRRRHPRNGQA